MIIIKVLPKSLNMKSLHSKIFRFSVVWSENGLEISVWAGQTCAGRAGPFFFCLELCFVQCWAVVLRPARLMPAPATTTGTSRAGPSSPTLLLYISFLLSGCAQQNISSFAYSDNSMVPPWMILETNCFELYLSEWCLPQDMPYFFVAIHTLEKQSVIMDWFSQRNRENPLGHDSSIVCWKL